MILRGMCLAPSVRMPTVPRHGDLEIDQDIDFQRREWRAQRIGRGVLFVIVLAALAGVFGGGPLATASVRTPDGRLRVEYDRIARHGAPTPLRVHVAPPASGDSVIGVWIDQAYMHGVILRGISPEPTEGQAGDQRLVYRFRLSDPSRAADIIFQVDGHELWSRHGAMGLVNGDSVRLRQFVLP